MRKHHRLGPRGIIGLMLGEPPRLAHREGGNRNTADGIGPGLGATPFTHKIIGRGRRPCVIPQEGIAHGLARGVEGHHPVLLACDSDRGDTIKHAVECLAQCIPPGAGVNRSALRMRGSRFANERTGVGITHDDLDRLGGGINSGDECHVAEARAQTRGRPECADAEGYPAHREEHQFRSPGRHP